MLDEWHETGDPLLPIRADAAIGPARFEKDRQAPALLARLLDLRRCWRAHTQVFIQLRDLEGGLARLVLGFFAE